MVRLRLALLAASTWQACEAFDSCPTTDEEIIVKIAIDRLARIDPTSIVMSLVAPNRQACCDNLRIAFCDRVSFYRDDEAFTRAIDGHTNVIGLDAEEAMALALRRNQLRYPNLKLSTRVDHHYR